jgi:hypothetical protein
LPKGPKSKELVSQNAKHGSSYLLIKLSVVRDAEFLCLGPVYMQQQTQYRLLLLTVTFTCTFL